MSYLFFDRPQPINGQANPLKKDNLQHCWRKEQVMAQKGADNRVMSLNDYLGGKTQQQSELRTPTPPSLASSWKTANEQVRELGWDTARQGFGEFMSGHLSGEFGLDETSGLGRWVAVEWTDKW
jgi:hypothetical protein